MLTKEGMIKEISHGHGSKIIITIPYYMIGKKMNFFHDEDSDSFILIDMPVTLFAACEIKIGIEIH